MKLEALNGNLVPLTGTKGSSQALEDENVDQNPPSPQHSEQQRGEKVESQASLSVASEAADTDMKDEMDEDEDMGAEEQQQQEEAEKESGVKKKGTRKKRSLNWEEAERGLLLEVIKSKVDFVENRSVDAKNIKAKRLAWQQITKQFNALNFRHRSLEQIQVQWRSMKNLGKREYQQKHSKSAPADGMELVEFMEEMQKDPVSVRSQTRGAAMLIKKELLEMDDEDTPLAALPTSVNTSEDTLQSSTIALPSPPPSADSQNDTKELTPTRTKKRASFASTVVTASVPGPVAAAGAAHKQQTSPALGLGGKPKRQRSQNSMNSDTTGATIVNETSPTAVQLPLTTTVSTAPIGPPTDDKYKKQLFELLKRARLAEIEHSRQEHEQKQRFEQMEQEMKLHYQRQLEELKLQQMREEHQTRMRHCQAEHEARMRIYTLKSALAGPGNGNGSGNGKSSAALDENADNGNGNSHI